MAGGHGWHRHSDEHFPFGGNGFRRTGTRQRRSRRRVLPTDGNGGYDVSNYHVVFGYDPGSRQFTGDTTITAKATQDLSAFNLDLYHLKVSSVTVDGKPATASTSGEHELTVKPETALSNGKQFKVEVKYAGVPEPISDPALGDNGWQYGQNGAAFAAGEPHGAATWFPVNDSPKDKATYHIMGTLPAGWSMISNGKDMGVTDAGGGKKTYHWQEDVPMASYLATASIDKWTYDRAKLDTGAVGPVGS